MKTTTAIIIALAAVAAFVPDALAAGSKPKRYPLKSCIITDNELGSMGKPLSRTYGDQEVRFCCKPCVKKFEQNPAKYLKKLGK
jgi:hypothetical protein